MYLITSPACLKALGGFSLHAGCTWPTRPCVSVPPPGLGRPHTPYLLHSPHLPPSHHISYPLIQSFWSLTLGQAVTTLTSLPRSLTWAIADWPVWFAHVLVGPRPRSISPSRNGASSGEDRVCLGAWHTVDVQLCSAPGGTVCVNNSVFMTKPSGRESSP